MRAIGGMLARQARARVAEAEVQSNEIIDLGPLLLPWKAGTASEPVSYKAGDVRTYGGQIDVYKRQRPSRRLSPDKEAPWRNST